MSVVAEYPQPHEGVRGTVREEAWLSKDPEMVEVRDAVARLTHCLWVITMGAFGDTGFKNNAQRTYERITQQRTGDLVIEISRAVRAKDVKMRHWGFGYLLAERDEWRSTDAEWLAECAEEGWDPVEEERTTEHVFYVQYGPRPEDICRWHNAIFITVPLDLFADYGLSDRGQFVEWT